MSNSTCPGAHLYLRTGCAKKYHNSALLSTSRALTIDSIPLAFAEGTSTNLVPVHCLSGDRLTRLDRYSPSPTVEPAVGWSGCLAACPFLEVFHFTRYTREES